MFRKKGVKLHITISLLFVMLTLPVMAIYVIVSYRSNAVIIAEYSSKFIDKSLNENKSNVTKLFNPIVTSARSAGTLMRDQPGYFKTESSADFLYEIVNSNEAVYGAYAAFEDGSFRQVRRAVKGSPVLGQPVPEGTKVISRYIEGRNKASAVDSYRFFSEWGTQVGEAAGQSTYDPRVRSYYKDAIALKTTNVSDPYVFASSGELGITVTTPVVSEGRTVGVMAVDLTLKTLSQFLSDNRVTPNTVTILADGAGGVIAHPQFELGLVKRGNDLVQNQLGKLEDPRVLGALAERLRTGQDRFNFRAGPDNAEYIGIFSPFPKDFKKPWELLMITPTDDFVGPIKRTNRNLFLFGLLAFLGQIILIYRLARMISKPMEQLAMDVTNIREFHFDRVSQVDSKVSEVRSLAEAIFMLTRALQSFTSYVPRGLVQQLLGSGLGTRLGVESCYLTMFFTDLEGFSSLSETEPSQQLLARVSEYFSSVTSSIESEQGTVDKYIGDAVMAFWGAPTRLENHAYLACVAAVRSQRRMTIKNMNWAMQKLPPLKVRIGIHSDSVLVGNIGSSERVSYTVMGDGVNVASRLEGINKEMGTWTCVSHSVFREAGERLWLRPMDTVTVKGRRGELLIYELLAIRDGDEETAATPAEIALCEMTTEAYGFYARGNFSEAARAYSRILEKFPHDPVAKNMLAKCSVAAVKVLA